MYIRMYVCVCECVCVCIYICIYIYIYMYVCMYVCMYVYWCVCVQASTPVHSEARPNFSFETLSESFKPVAQVVKHVSS